MGGGLEEVLSLTVLDLMAGLPATSSRADLWRGSHVPLLHLQPERGPAEGQGGCTFKLSAVGLFVPSIHHMSFLPSWFVGMDASSKIPLTTVSGHEDAGNAEGQHAKTRGGRMHLRVHFLTLLCYTESICTEKGLRFGHCPRVRPVRYKGLHDAEPP